MRNSVVAKTYLLWLDLFQRKLSALVTDERRGAEIRYLSAMSLVKRNSVPPWRRSVSFSVLPTLLPFFRRSVRKEIRRTRRVEAKTKDPPYETRHCVETKTAVADSTLKTGGIDA